MLSGGGRHHDPESLPDWFLWLVAIAIVVSAIYWTITLAS